MKPIKTKMFEVPIMFELIKIHNGQIHTGEWLNLVPIRFKTQAHKNMTNILDFFKDQEVTEKLREKVIHSFQDILEEEIMVGHLTPEGWNLERSN